MAHRGSAAYSAAYIDRAARDGRMMDPAAERLAIHAGAGRCVRGAATSAFGENPQATGVIRVAAGINVAANRANIGKILAGGLVPRAVSKPGVEKRRKTCAGAG